MKYKDGSQIKDEECTKDSVYDTKVGRTRTGEGKGLGEVWGGGGRKVVHCADAKCALMNCAFIHGAGPSKRLHIVVPPHSASSAIGNAIEMPSQCERAREQNN